MNNKIIVKESNLDDVLIVHQNIIEFDEKYPTKSFFQNRYKSLEHIILVAYYNNIPIGYIIGYEIDDNNFYCWLAGVNYNYRRMGALNEMFNHLKDWCRNKGYHKISIKTRNRYREMLTFLVKNNWNFVEIEAKENVENYRISLELSI